MERLMTRRDVEAHCGLSRTSIYRLMRAGQFPEAVKVGPKAVRWRQSEINAWLQARPRATGDGPRPAA